MVDEQLGAGDVEHELGDRAEVGGAEAGRLEAGLVVARELDRLGPHHHRDGAGGDVLPCGTR
jgi:hypothetical protein